MNPSTVKKGQKPGTPTPVGGNLKTGLKYFILFYSQIDHLK